MALYNLLVVNMRHCIVCGIACGIHHEVSAVDPATLTEAEYIRHPPRSGAAHLCCGTCLQVADGFKGRLLSYALMASAGHLVLLRRLFSEGKSAPTWRVSYEHGAGKWQTGRH